MNKLFIIVTAQHYQNLTSLKYLLRNQINNEIAVKCRYMLVPKVQTKTIQDLNLLHKSSDMSVLVPDIPGIFLFHHYTHDVHTEYMHTDVHTEKTQRFVGHRSNKDIDR